MDQIVQVPALWRSLSSRETDNRRLNKKCIIYYQVRISTGLGAALRA